MMSPPATAQAPVAERPIALPPESGKEPYGYLSSLVRDLVFGPDETRAMGGGREVAMIFADVRLRGVMDGVDLAWEVKLRWPLLPVILTSGLPRERVGDLPLGVDYMPKPWHADRRRTGASVCARRLTSAIAARFAQTCCPPRLVMPAFGVFAGGLNVRNHAFADVFGTSLSPRTCSARRGSMLSPLGGVSRIERSS
jgi:hypothetical protein